MCSNTVRLIAFTLLASSPCAFAAEKFYTYIGDAGPTHILIAWGTTDGGNTIGRTSASHGPATVRIAGQDLTVTDRNWTVIRNLTPDTEYQYEVLLKGSRIGYAKVRTWPEKTDKLRFFVIGDFGTGDSNQQRVADAMWKEYQRLSGDNPVRFVLCTGDTIYGQVGLTLRFRKTGDEDDEWGPKFFGPYEPLLARMPFYASLGNHDGNETESRGDLKTFLDNFFFPEVQPARYYRFSYGGLADFFALDTTTNSEEGPPRPAYAENSAQHKWLAKNISESQVPWKIPFMHHPPFNAGPRHPASLQELKHFITLFQKNGVRVVFSGHEHNFQFSDKSAATGDIRYVITGAGGELRRGDVIDEMPRAHIEGWAAHVHFLSVEIDGKEMRITPLSYEDFDTVDKNRHKIEMPLKVTLP